MEINWKELCRPLDKYRWKLNSISKAKTKCNCVAYFDARDLEKRLDEVLGQENWKDEYYSVKDTMFCRLSINTENGWLSKSGAGERPKISGAKGEASDAFKLAGVKHGILRDVYDIQGQWLDYDPQKKVPLDFSRKPLYKDDLSIFLNNRLNDTPDKIRERRAKKKEQDEARRIVKSAKNKNLSNAKDEAIFLLDLNSKLFNSASLKALLKDIEESNDSSIYDWVRSKIDTIEHLKRGSAYINADLKVELYNKILVASLIELEEIKDEINIALEQGEII
jgi:hypothetical protein